MNTKTTGNVIGKKVVAAMVMLSLCLVTLPTGQASIAGARRTSAAMFLLLKSQGWEVREFASSGLLRRGRSTILRTTLYAGNDYRLVASGCEDSFDVDLAVYDEDGNLVGEDSDYTNLAVVAVTPRWTGTFYLKVTMADSTPDGAHWVVQYAFTDL